MSSTRHAKPGGPPRQERFASELESGLLANLVAKRCSTIIQREDRAPIWFLQWLSWQPGGLAKTAGAVHDYVELCLNPRFGLGCEWEAACELRHRYVGSVPTVGTDVGRRISEALSYAQASRTMVLIDGAARIGKSFAAKAWCKGSAGLMRYVEVPCSNDDIAFYRAIGRALGVSSSLQLKAAEVRARVEDTLLGGDLGLVFDEAHYLWPQNWQRYAMPARVNWVMTALVNAGVSVAIITTPQFLRLQKNVERLTGWNSEQFIGRISHLERLPDKLPFEDRFSIARSMLPKCDDETWSAVASFAGQSSTRLGSMDAIARRSAWFASLEGRNVALPEDVRRVMRERISSFDNPMSGQTGLDSGKRIVSGFGEDLGRSCSDASAAVPRVTLSDTGALR